MLKAISFVLALLIVGDVFAATLEMPFPGAALGLAALIGLFVVAGEPDPDIARIFDAIAPHVPMFFVPAAVGVVAHLEAVSAFWLHFAAAIVASTGAAILATGLIAKAILRRLETTVIH